ncbi:MAG: MotA/TolQ/ExbB proton channel family protein [Nitrospinota bacterium]
MAVFSNFFTDGGFFMYLILIISVFGIGISIERAYFLILKNRISGKNLWEKISAFVSENKIDEAVAICNQLDAPIAKILKEGLTSGASSPKSIQDVIEEKSLELIPTIDRRIPYIGMLANVATLMGLLGTITGLIQAFQVVGDADPSQKSALLAHGISIAMNTTAFGLIVAIPLVISHTYMVSKANRLIEEVDEFSFRLINLLSSKRTTG